MVRVPSSIQGPSFSQLAASDAKSQKATTSRKLFDDGNIKTTFALSLSSSNVMFVRSCRVCVIYVAAILSSLVLLVPCAMVHTQVARESATAAHLFALSLLGQCCCSSWGPRQAGSSGVFLKLALSRAPGPMGFTLLVRSDSFFPRLQFCCSPRSARC